MTSLRRRDTAVAPGAQFDTWLANHLESAETWHLINETMGRIVESRNADSQALAWRKLVDKQWPDVVYARLQESVRRTVPVYYSRYGLYVAFSHTTRQQGVFALRDIPEQVFIGPPYSGLLMTKDEFQNTWLNNRPSPFVIFEKLKYVLEFSTTTTPGHSTKILDPTDPFGRLWPVSASGNVLPHVRDATEGTPANATFWINPDFDDKKHKTSVQAGVYPITMASTHDIPAHTEIVCHWYRSALFRELVGETGETGETVAPPIDPSAIDEIRGWTPPTAQAKKLLFFSAPPPRSTRTPKRESNWIDIGTWADADADAVDRMRPALPMETKETLQPQWQNGSFVWGAFTVKSRERKDEEVEESEDERKKSAVVASVGRRCTKTNLGLFATTALSPGVRIPVYGVPIDALMLDQAEQDERANYLIATPYALLNGDRAIKPSGRTCIGGEGLFATSLINEPVGEQPSNLTIERDGSYHVIQPIRPGEEMLVCYGPSFVRSGYTVSSKCHTRAAGSRKQR